MEEKVNSKRKVLLIIAIILMIISLITIVGIVWAMNKVNFQGLDESRNKSRNV